MFRPSLQLRDYANNESAIDNLSIPPRNLTL